MLLDSNIIIYLSQPEYLSLRAYFADKEIHTSAVCKIETLGFDKLTPIKKKYLEEFFELVNCIAITDEIVDGAIELRQIHDLSLGDSIIAATALNSRLDLATRNIGDFKRIKGLKLVDPFSKISHGQSLSI